MANNNFESNELIDFKNTSYDLGNNFQLVQAAGGNTSIKSENTTLLCDRAVSAQASSASPAPASASASFGFVGMSSRGNRGGGKCQMGLAARRLDARAR